MTSYLSQSHDTIVAIATPPGTGGVAIVRLSGYKAMSLASLLVGENVLPKESHRAKLVTVRSTSGHALDKALCLFFQSPRSFTGEDTVEFHCHGGHLLAQAVVEALVRVGARVALPGEFTLRAFLNGKVDLAQAEAIQDLIGAKNEKALQVAEAQLEGRLSKEISFMQQEGSHLAAIFEAWVDFPEEGLEFESQESVLLKLHTLFSKVTALLDTYHDGKIIHDGVSICLLGAPNVGKSSLMNALLGKERAIVSHIAGTTRDTIEEDLRLEGIQCRLTDTAGIRKTNELIEGEGVKRSLKAIKTADIVFVVLDASRPDESDGEELLKEAAAGHVCLIWNKIDLKQSDLVLPTYGVSEAVFVSAKTGQGLDDVRHAVRHILWKGEPMHHDEVLITNVRHKEALIRAQEALTKVIEGLQENLSPEFITFDMREFLRHLGSVIGTDITEDILSAIFSQFCVGK